MSSPSPEQREYAAVLIAKAAGDQQAAHALALAGVVDEAIGFHAQQAVEKAVKSVLVVARTSLPHTHDLERLLALASESDWPPPPTVVEAGWLTIDGGREGIARPLGATFLDGTYRTATTIRMIATSQVIVRTATDPDL